MPLRVVSQRPVVVWLSLLAWVIPPILRRSDAGVLERCGSVLVSLPFFT